MSLKNYAYNVIHVLLALACIYGAATSPEMYDTKLELFKACAFPYFIGVIMIWVLHGIDMENEQAESTKQG